MRPPMLLCVALTCALAAFPAAAHAGSWSGSWTNDGVGTSGSAHLSVARTTTLRLAGAALGCAQPVVLRVRYAHGHVVGSGRDVPCNHGLRWRISGPPEAATLTVRLPDGSGAQLRLQLRRRR